MGFFYYFYVQVRHNIFSIIFHDKWMENKKIKKENELCILRI